MKIRSGFVSNSSSSSFIVALKGDDSLKCFTINDAKTLLKFANRGILCDSLTNAYDEKIETLSKIIKNKDGQILLADDLIQLQHTKIKGLEKSANRMKILCGILSGAVLVELVVILFP